MSTLTTSPLRERLHALIDAVADERVLSAVIQLLEAPAVQADALDAVAWYDEPVVVADLPPAVREAVEEGLRQSEAGLGRPHEEVWAEFEAKYGVKCRP